MNESTDALLTRFRAWLQDAKERGVPEPTAMALATVDAEGRPEVRMVLLKHADARGFVFYTNLESPKSVSLRARPRAELAFYWNPPGRQVRISGAVESVSDDEADAYFASRPYLSRLGAWASDQSRPLPDSTALARRVACYGLRWPVGVVPRPPHWGGYRVVPDRIEFWEEKTFRLHDRVVCRREPDGSWESTPLFP
ncbi:MAG: pyridoxamine 5'-phosphate oxidase [Opitutaceae bacterium]|jgi:pyridoxamine 5'-phosphate oxidase|nr:pyridoxamine 5'-phosphate oxidase [Opitutaceae bacterium]